VLQEIPFYFVLVLSWTWPFIVVIGFLSLLNKLTAKPKALPHIDTPEEAAGRKAEALAMIAQTEESRREYAAHHH
jgi:hypothetical protein